MVTIVLAGGVWEDSPDGGATEFRMRSRNPIRQQPCSGCAQLVSRLMYGAQRGSSELREIEVVETYDGDFIGTVQS